LGPGGHFFREVLNLRVSKIARGPKSASAGNSRASSAGNVFCRERLLQEGRREMGGVSAGGKLKRKHVSSARGLKEATSLSSAGGLMRARCHLQRV